VPPPAAHGSSWRRGVVAGVAAVAVALGSALVIDHVRGSSNQPVTASSPTGQSGQLDPYGQNGPRYRWPDPSGSGGSAGGDGSLPGTTTGTATSATAAQQVGVVDIDTVLNFGTGKAAGTGIVLTAAGEILTNNHVVAGSTSITVTVVSTGAKYTATVVGTDPTDDIAVLQLRNASGLATAKLGNSAGVRVADAVTAVGNAGGIGGTPSAAAGTVTALNQSITATDENGGNAEKLTGLIQTDADVEAGDSGGPLFDADNTVVGMDTAASVSRTRATAGYAIPIATAVRIANAIETRVETSTIHIGYPAFLGVELSANSTGATIAGVVDNSAAARAGLAAGDTVTALNGTRIASASGLSAAIAALDPGQRATVTWVDTSGSTHTATVTLTAGPVD
jgi:S1-C subfamily serine protease